MARTFKMIIKKILLAPLWILGWVLFGVLYVEAWLVDFIESEED